MEKSSSQKFYERTGMTDCLENEASFCIVKCPFHFNVPEFMDKIQRGSFHTAFRDFKNAVGFPRIALEVCDERCKNVCPRKDKDSPLQMKLLERAAMQYAKNTNPTEFNLPRKDKKIAVVGAGICGMACALRLCEKKYQVDIYEKTEKIGGRLWETMDSSIFLEDFEKQFMFEKYELNLNCEIKSADSLANQYDAVFLATGAEGLKAEGNGIFAGGALLGMNGLDSLAYGLEAAKQIEAYLKTGIMRQTAHEYCTQMPFPDMDELAACFPKMSGIGGFSEEEAKSEAGRCLRCKCDACRRHCDLLLYYKKSPLKAMEEVRATTEVKGVLAENMTIATKMIASCSQCGLCAEVCPENIDFKSIILEARRMLHKKGALPWAFHDFFLRDMEFANGEAGFTINPCCSSNPNYIFFPGCQLGASDPGYVAGSYRLLLEHYPDTVLVHRCCGAPAVWAGDEELQNQVFDQFRKQWESCDKPEIIFACPACKKMFAEYLPDIKGEFLYTFFADLDIDVRPKSHASPASVFDPCNARNDAAVQFAVRKLSEKAGYKLTRLRYEGAMAKCCGFGGSSRIVNPEKAKETAERRIVQSEDIYITYCVNCRDVFAEHGKEAIHILDAVLDINSFGRFVPTITQRRRNREILRSALMKEFYGMESSMNEERNPNIIISDKLKQKLNRNLILEEEAIDVISYCEASGSKVLNRKNNTFCGYRKIGYMTYWVEYRYAEEGIELVNAYSHRMTIRG